MAAVTCPGCLERDERIAAWSAASPNSRRAWAPTPPTPARRPRPSPAEGQDWAIDCPLGGEARGRFVTDAVNDYLTRPASRARSLSRPPWRSAGCCCATATPPWCCAARRAPLSARH